MGVGVKSSAKKGVRFCAWKVFGKMSQRKNT